MIMRLLVFFLVLISVSAAREELPVIHLDMTTSCPGNNLHIVATANGVPAEDVEIRLVLYEPFYGLRALKHTDSKGEADFQVDKTGKYRVYLSSDYYEHEPFEILFVPNLCPPPPAKQFNVSTALNCKQGLVLISVYHGGEAISDATVESSGWAALTPSDGILIFPIEGNEMKIKVFKAGFANKSGILDTRCSFSCISSQDCEEDEYCVQGDCKQLTGECGRPINHTWVPYECCDDSACPEDLYCRAFICVVLPKEPPEPPDNGLNDTANESGATPPVELPDVCSGVFFLLFLFMKQVLLR